MSSQPQKAPDPDDQNGWTLDDKRALDDLFTRLYEKIRLLAARIRYTSGNPTLNPTALVHEAYMKLQKHPAGIALKPYDDIVALFANAMRQILIDAARRKSARKRVSVDLPERPDLPIEDALTLDAAMSDLERENKTRARIVQCRFLLGMTVVETAAALDLSARTVEREWQEAKISLNQRLAGTAEIK